MSKEHHFTKAARERREAAERNGSAQPVTQEKTSTRAYTPPANKPFIFVLTQKINNPATKGKHSPAVVTIPTEDVIFDGKQQRMIRYVPGEKSIYADEQSPEAKNTKSEILVTNGAKAVDPRETLLLQYLKVCNWNEANPNRMPESRTLFRPHDTSALYKTNSDKDMLVTRAKMKVYDMSTSVLLDTADSLGINVNREFELVKHDLLIKAESKPELFISKLVRNDKPKEEELHEEESSTSVEETTNVE